MSDSQKTESSLAEFFVSRFIWVGLAIFVAWLVVGFWVPVVYLRWSGIPKEIQYAGQFGDMFGAVNSLFSGFAFFVAMMALMLQTVEMRQAGERRVDEAEQETEQRKIQLRQTKLAARTAFIQQELITNAKQVRIDAYFSAILEHAAEVEYEFIAYHTSCSERKRTPKRDTQDALAHSYRILELRVKMQAKYLGSAMMFGKLGGDLVLVLYKWPHFISDQLASMPLSSDTELPDYDVFRTAYQDLVGETLTEMGKLSQHIVTRPD